MPLWTGSLSERKIIPYTTRRIGYLLRNSPADDILFKNHRKKDKTLKKLRTLLYVVCMGAILTVPAFAYVDPSVTTFAFQAIAAVVIAAGAVIGVVWRKAKKKAAQVLNIDENAGKVVEEDLVVNEEPAAEETVEVVEAAAEEPAAE